MEPGTPDEKVSERRRAPRRGALKNAVIVFNNGHCTMGCQIVDMSDTGAKLMPADILLCPKEFVLKPQIGEPRNCEVMWRRGTKIGVYYVLTSMRTTAHGSNSIASRSYCPRHIEQTVASLIDGFGLYPLPDPSRRERT
jgi:hypothetical protein